MKIRAKIMLGFLILSVMLAVAGAYSIYELNTLSASVQAILDDNYKSIYAAKHMIESLEREDSGILLLLSGKWKEGRETVGQADKNFSEAYQTARENITIPGEKTQIDIIQSKYAAFKQNWEQPIVDTVREENLNWYFEKVHEDFIAAKIAVEVLMDLNDQTMYQTASMLKDRARRTVMPGIVAILTAIVFSMIFSFFVNLYFVNPILLITKNVKKFLQTGQMGKIAIDTRDEIHDLSNAIQNIVVMIGNEKQK